MSRYLRNKRALYSIITTYILIITLLAAVAVLFMVNTSMLKISEDKSLAFRTTHELKQYRDRMYSCFGNVVEEQELLEHLDCLELRAGEGISIDRLRYSTCPYGPVKELNYRGYGRIMQFNIPMYDPQRENVCPARMTVYEHGAIVPLILNVTTAPRVGVQGTFFNTTVNFYHTLFPSFLNISVQDISGNSVMMFDSGPLFNNTNTMAVQIDSTSMIPGIYRTVTYATNDYVFVDEQEGSRFRVVNASDKPILDWFKLWPGEGTIRQRFHVAVNMSDYVNITWVTILFEDDTGVVRFFNLTEDYAYLDLEALVQHHSFVDSFSGGIFPNSNATYMVSLVAGNELGNIANFDNLTNITLIQTNALDVAVVGVKKLLQDIYSDAEIASLESKINEYVDAVSLSGLSAQFFYLDGDETQQAVGSMLTSYSYNDIDAVLELLHDELNMSYIVIIGGHKTFPQAKWDAELTDDTYGDMDNDLVPDIIVGRIIDPLKGDMALMLDTLDNSIQKHNSGGLDFTAYHSDAMNDDWSSMTCFNEQVWGDARAANTHWKDFDCSALTHANSQGFFALLMHGDSLPQEFACNSAAECSCGWRGGGTSPSDVARLTLDGAVWLTMPCFGGQISNKNTVADSIPMSFHKAGGLVYVGGTNSNLGGSGSCLTFNGVKVGDYFVGAVYSMISQYLVPDATIGEAYLLGKRDYDQYVPDRENYHDYQLHILCFYGDPTLKIAKVW